MSQDNSLSPLPNFGRERGRQSASVVTGSGAGAPAPQTLATGEMPAASVAGGNQMANLIKAIEAMSLAQDDLRRLARLFSATNVHRLDEADPDGTIYEHVGKALSTLSQSPAPSVEPVEENVRIPPLSEAPRNTFQGVRVQGDPYAYLISTYGPWLQEGKKCLDRPTLEVLDARLLKALQQRFSRGTDPNMPPLSSIFPSKTEAERNRKRCHLPPLGREVAKKIS